MAIRDINHVHRRLSKMNAADSQKLRSFDLAQLRSIFESDEAGLNEILRSVMQDLIQFERRCVASRKEGDQLAIGKLAHALIGPSGMSGAEETCQLAQRLCDDLRLSGTMSDEIVEGLIGAVRHNLEDLRQAGFLAA